MRNEWNIVVVVRGNGISVIRYTFSGIILIMKLSDQQNINF